MMKYYARFNANDFVINELPNLNDSSSETSFSELEIDFRGFTETSVPIQYQEITIVQIDDDLNETILMVGYVESVEYPEFAFEDQPLKLNITLLSPYAYASKRNISAQINTIALNTAITTILQPLIDDGFTIDVNELSTENVSEIFQNETVEKVMNYLANKFNFIWYIDKAKKIYLKDINLLIGQDPVITITNDNKCFLQSIKPVKTVVDYANKLNIKNVVLLDTGTLLPVGTVLTKDTTYEFTYPISISENTAYRLQAWDVDDPTYAYSFLLPTNDVNFYEIEINFAAKTITYDAQIGFAGIDDDTAKKILLITDETDTTKVTGFKWNGASSETVNGYGGLLGCFSASILTPYQVSYIDPVEISTIKDKINTSGVIEKVVDANLKYFNYKEIQSYAVSLLSQNNAQTNAIECKFKGRLNDIDFIAIRDALLITKVFSVDLPTFLISGKFIITETSYTANTETAVLSLKAKNYNLNESYLDIFRKSIEEESEDTLTRKLIVFYNQDNKTVLNKQVIVNDEVVNNE